MSMINTTKLLSVSIIALLVLLGCSSPKEQEDPTQSNLPTISVAEVVHENITEWDEFTGRLQAPQTVALVPRVSGYIDKIHFSEGALVEKGDLLIQIDPMPYMHEVNRLKAELESAQSAAAFAVSDYQRAETLSSQRAISAEILDSRLAHKKQTAAAVNSVQAALERAELDLSYTRVTAPISGRVSYAQVTVGNFVSAGQTQLTNVVSTDKMYAYFDIDEQSYLRYARLTRAGHRVDARDVSANPVLMALANDTSYNYIGNVDFVDNRINPQTGTIRIRASFPNLDNDLLPGLFARIRLAGSNAYDAILIDEKAIGSDLNHRFVLVVNRNDQLEYRAVQLGGQVNGLRIIREGLESTDRIVVNGLQRVAPNMQINPQLVQMASDEQLEQIRLAQRLLELVSQDVIAQTDTANDKG